MIWESPITKPDPFVDGEVLELEGGYAFVIEGTLLCVLPGARWKFSSHRDSTWLSSTGFSYVVRHGERMHK